MASSNASGCSYGSMCPRRGSHRLCALGGSVAKAQERDLQSILQTALRYRARVGAQQHQPGQAAPHEVWLAQAKHEAQEAAHRVTDECAVLDFVVVEQSGVVAHERGRAQAVTADGRRAVTSLVERDHTVACRHQRIEHEVVQRQVEQVAVRQYDRGTRSSTHTTNTCAVGALQQLHTSSRRQQERVVVGQGMGSLGRLGHAAGTLPDPRCSCSCIDDDSASTSADRDRRARECRPAS